MTGINYFKHKNPLWGKLEKRVLPFVSKPGRYVGNELNAVVKNHDGKLKIALAFPDMYEIGMSYLGQQILYNIINNRDDCVAERVFQVWPDTEKLLRQHKIPIFSLETTTPLSEFDIIGFSVTYEMHAPGILNILDLASIPLKSKERGENDPLIIAGGSAVINPEPLADFFDAIFIGDAEEAINEIIDLSIKSRNESRQSKLLALSQIEGMYIPSFYKDEYENNRLKSISPIREDIPEKIKIRSCRTLDRSFYPAKPLVPFVETTHDRLSIEIMRGCVRGCRFCQAGYQYRPRRNRQPDDIFCQIQDSYRATGFDEITLLSLSSTDYPDLDRMISGIMPFLQQNHISVSLPSLRPGSLSSVMLEYLKSQRKTGITIAPEAGTQRLRNVIGKNITRDEILDGIRKIFEHDWTLVKLYFMIGLPTETDSDIDGIIDMIKEISKLAGSMGGKKNINATISPFCPKPGTPWQWEQQLDADRLSAIYERLKQNIRNRNVSLKFRDPRLSVIEGIIGRGDRRMSEVIINAYRKGARLDGWSEFFDYDIWGKAVIEHGHKIDDLLQFKIADLPLPWEHIEKGIPKKFLLDERSRSLKGELMPGAKPEVSPDKAIYNGEYGRPRKKKISVSAVPTKTKIRLKYSRDERLRFMSHLDMIRAFHRAIRRAELPVSFSQGFHPHMKLSFGPPLVLGYTSEAEYMDIQLDSPFEKNHLARLNECLPPGFRITASKLIFTKTDSLTKVINCASYRVETENIDRVVAENIFDLLESKTLVARRVKNDEIKEYSVGRLLHGLSYNNGVFEMILGFTPDGYLRPNEVLIFGLGLSETESLPLIYKRTGQYFLQGVHKVEPLDLI